jgi:putative heme-binding domain-containing protein
MRCHKLFGEGGAVGPELTGSQRSDLGYLIENMVAPSAAVAADYRLSVFSLADGRVLNGLATKRGGGSVTIVTPTEEVVVPAGEIEEERRTEVSLMPEGLLDGLDREQVADLIRYLQSDRGPSAGGR